MQIVKASFSIEDEIDGEAMLKRIERAGRTCYKSEMKITDSTAHAFVARVIASGHESVIEHEKVTVRIVCDRGVSHELVRHRIASYSQESTRYVNYGKRGGVAYVLPVWVTPDTAECRLWQAGCAANEREYLDALSRGWKAQEARGFLNHFVKTELVSTLNFRSWRNFFRLRSVFAAHPSMREIVVPMLAAFKQLIPVVFDDICVA